MTSALKAICQDLDDTLSEFFGVSQELTECQHELGRILADGFLFMAKARYSMGVKAVGQLQYDENQMERGARLHVLVEDGEFFLKTNTSYLKSTKSQSETGVVKRHVVERSDDVDVISAAVQDIGISQFGGSADSDVQNDPIKWFGVLVPQSLRHSQSRFKKAAEVSCKIASLKAKYCTLQQRYRDLKSKKWHLLNDPPELPDF